MMFAVPRNLAACLVVMSSIGCNSSTTHPPVPAPAVEDHSGHDHGSHPDTGPNGGHLVELGDGAYHIEWTHDDESGLVSLCVLDSAAKELIPIVADAITIVAKVSEAKDYRLTAVASSGDPPKSATFELKNPELIVNLKMAGQGADVSVIVTIDGQEYRGEFVHHEHAHGHRH